MIAADLADLIGARQKSRGIWAARCPVCQRDYLSLRISGGPYAVANVRCEEGCSIYEIVPGLGLNWNEYTLRPKSVPPDFGEMGESEIRAYFASEREREAKHKAACEKIELLRRHLLRLKRRIADQSTAIVSSELEVKLEQTERRLKLACQQEIRLRR